ncbi:FAR1 domain-containing protein [Cephalotus follicularis]|uniref:FAR1 domain-containing protein n=1 Tax=Cephalotus follicularis TaxID=3775 RepID=A0A1Q3DJA2_CEPFO|nr:FAR1 domain-containing protein [Cephalotus follicularis]
MNILPSAVPSEEITKIDMEFNSEDAAYEFYKSYSKKSGFGIRKAYRHVYKESNEVLDRTFCCARAGKKRNDKPDVNVKCPRAESRCGCSAMMVFSTRHSGNFRVMKFVVEHNHVLSTPRKVHLHRLHRKITFAQAAEACLAESSGMRPKETLEFMGRQVGGREH